MSKKQTLNYEIRPCADNEGCIINVQESQAQFWGLYKIVTSENGLRLPVFVADFSTKKAAYHALTF